MILSGKRVAERILGEVKSLVGSSGIVPGLAVVLVGDDPASRVYVGIKERRTEELGFRFMKREFPVSASEADLAVVVGGLNADPSIHGIVVQLPLPAGIDADRVIGSIDPMKDADGFLGDRPVFPEAIVELAKSAGMPLAGKTGIVLANSERFGEAMAQALGAEGVVTEYILIPDPADERIRSADIVVTALGKPEFLSRSVFRKGAVVIDGGIAEKDGKVVGDVSRDGGDTDIFLSPVPGGVGPVTVACLLRRVADLAMKNPA